MSLGYMSYVMYVNVKLVQSYTKHKKEKEKEKEERDEGKFIRDSKRTPREKKGRGQIGLIFFHHMSL